MMVGYGVIQDSEVMLQGAKRKPVTASLLFRFRDNPIAMCEGATGAPRFQRDSIQDAAVNTAKFGDTSITGDRIALGVVTGPKFGNGQVAAGKFDTHLFEGNAAAAAFYFGPGSTSGGVDFAEQEYAFVPIAKGTAFTNVQKAEFAKGATNGVFHTMMRVIDGGNADYQNRFVKE